ncbi:alcohol acetyltransferase [Lipomyces orientalis]|uniref:Alcohol acetyltransferase n=1 Tax=Lipomyces orientalis TaxID=1233043 RepID=A0ACC3TJD5_9ASCO
MKFALAKEVDLDKIVEYRTTTESFEEFLAELHEVRFTYEAMTPVWKLFVWNEKTVAFVFDHGPLDGTSGALFHVQLAELLNDRNSLLSADISPIVKVDQSMKLNPAVDSIVSTSPSLPFVVSTLFHEFVPKWGPFSPSAERDGTIFAPHVHPVEGSTWRILEIPAARVNILLNKCRAQNTTLTALCHTLLVMGMSKAYPSVAGFDTSVPINARRFMTSYSDAANEMGAYVFQYKEITSAQKEFSWDEVIRFGSALKKGTTKRSGYILGMLKYLFGNISGWMEAKLGKVRESDIELSNVGAWKFTEGIDDEMSYKVLQLGFSQPHGTLNPPIKLNCAGVVGGNTTLTLGFSDKIAGEGKGDVVFGVIKHMVDKLSETD